MYFFTLLLYLLHAAVGCTGVPVFILSVAIEDAKTRRPGPALPAISGIHISYGEYRTVICRTCGHEKRKTLPSLPARGVHYLHLDHGDKRLHLCSFIIDLSYTNDCWTCWWLSDSLALYSLIHTSTRYTQRPPRPPGTCRQHLVCVRAPTTLLFNNPNHVYYAAVWDRLNHYDWTQSSFVRAAYLLAYRLLVVPAVSVRSVYRVVYYCNSTTD